MRQMRKKVSLVLIAALVLSSFAGTGEVQAKKKKDKVKAKVTSVSITNVDKKLRLKKGTTFRLKSEVKVKPNQAKYKKVKYTSSNRKVVLVNSQGRLKGKKVGTAKITVMSKQDASKKASIKVNVTNDILVKTIKLDRKKITVDEYNEEDIKINVTKILPSNAKNKDINWSSSNEKVADVDEDGVVTSGDVGSAIITATADDNGGASATCTVVVTENKDNDADEEEPDVPTVTEAPTPVPPVTEAPTQVPPVTEAPTQVPPVTEAPTPVPPVTEAPTQVPPVTEAPTPVPPVTEAPTQVPPVTEAPTQVPSVTEAPIPIPIPTNVPQMAVEYKFLDLYRPEGGSFGSQAKVTAAKDENDEACTEIHYTHNNQYIFLQFPDEIDLSKYESVSIKANVPAQLDFRIFNTELDDTTDGWWSVYAEYVNYPFYHGSKTEDGNRGIETVEYDLSDVEENGKMCNMLTFISNTMPNNGYGSENYLIYDIILIPKNVSDPVIIVGADNNATDKPSEPTVTQGPVPTLDTDIVKMSQDRETAWSTEGNYGSQTYNDDDGLVMFSTEPKSEEAEGSIYCNGIGWYLSDDKKPVDISAYDTIQVTVYGYYYNVVLRTWSDGAYSDVYWDKYDSWGGRWSESPVKNADGSYTLSYNVKDVFLNPENASAVGLGLKACDDDDEATYVPSSMTIHSIRFVRKESMDPTEAPVSTPRATEEPVPTLTPTPAPPKKFMFTDLYRPEGGSFGSQANVIAVRDENHVPSTEIQYTKENQYIFLQLPEAIDLSKYQSVSIEANVPGQLDFRIFNTELDDTTDGWWSVYAEYVNYPFYHGSKTEEGMRGIEMAMFDLSDVEENGKKCDMIALISNNTTEYGFENYLIYNIKLTPKYAWDPEITIGADRYASETPSIPSCETGDGEIPETDTVEMS